MPKKSRFTPERSPSKLQLSKWERQKKLQRLILISGIFIIVAVFGIIAFGYYGSRIKPSLAEKQELSQPAFGVNDKVFSSDSLLKMLIFFGLRRPEQPADMPLTNFVIEFMQTSEIISQEARKLNIGVSAEEVEKELRKSFAAKNDEEFKSIYRANFELKTDFTDEEYRAFVSSELTKQKVRDEFIAPKVPAEETQVQVERILLRTEDDARKVAEQLRGGAAFATLVKEQSQDVVSKEKDGNTGWITREEVSKAFDDAAFKLKKGETSQPFFDEAAFVKGGYWILKLTEKQDNSVKAHGILLRTEAEAREIKSRLEKGEDFTALAKELSLDFFASETGGDLGEISKGSQTPEFEQVVFNLEPGALGGPVFDAGRTIKGGYWVVRAVEEPQMRALEKSTLEMRQAQAFQKWLDEKKQDYRLETFLDDGKKTSIFLRAGATVMLKQQQLKSKIR